MKVTVLCSKTMFHISYGTNSKENYNLLNLRVSVLIHSSKPLQQAEPQTIGSSTIHSSTFYTNIMRIIIMPSEKT